MAHYFFSLCGNTKDGLQKRILLDGKERFGGDEEKYKIATAFLMLVSNPKDMAFNEVCVHAD